MLYDPKWEQKTKADLMTLGSLIAWLEKQPASGSYNYRDCQGDCLLDQYLTAATGKPSIPDPDTHWKTCGGPENYIAIARTRPWTFGAALKRARAVKLALQWCGDQTGDDFYCDESPPVRGE